MEKTKCLGIDVGGTSVKLGLFSLDGELLDNWSIPTRKIQNGAFVLGDIASSIEGRLKEAGISKEEVVGAGMGIPGPVNEEGLCYSAVNIGWKESYIGRELEKLLGLPVTLANDANVAAYGESWKGGGSGYENLVMVTLGTGVGSGIIIRGKLRAGSHGLAGELGHIVVNPDEKESCNCGNHGCLEQYASATGVVHTARSILERTPVPSLLRENYAFTAKDVFDEAKKGDAVAVLAVDTLARYLGIALAVATLTVDPDIILLGGGVSKAGKYLLDLCESYLVRYTPITMHRPKLGLATLGNDAGIYGGARLALETYKESLGA